MYLYNILTSVHTEKEGREGEEEGERASGEGAKRVWLT